MTADFKQKFSNIVNDASRLVGKDGNTPSSANYENFIDTDDRRHFEGVEYERSFVEKQCSRCLPLSVINGFDRFKTLVSGTGASTGTGKIPGMCCPQGKRYQIAFMASLGFLISFGIRCNMGVAIEEMTRNITKFDDGNITFTFQEFEWSPTARGLIESSFFWGYLITQVPGGYLAAKFRAHQVFGTALCISSFLNLFIPAAAKLHMSAVISVRILQGIVEGVTYPACHGIWRYWAPPLERSRLATIAFTGSYAGAVVGIPLSGKLSYYVGWSSSFYFYGVFGIIWFFFWSIMSDERPGTCRSISPEERLYIEESLGESESSSLGKKLWIKPPWKQMMTSMPVWAIIVANFCRSWSFYLLIVSQAQYFIEALQYKIGENAMQAALPHLTMIFIVPLGGQLADFLRQKYLTTTTVRKMMNCGGFGMEAVFLMTVAFQKKPHYAVAFLTVAVGFSGFAISGYNVNHLDIAPRFASILMGLSNGIGTFAGMLVPICTEQLTKNSTKGEWSKVFIIAAIIHFCGVIFYGIFASGEKQSWAEPNKGNDFIEDAANKNYGATTQLNEKIVDGDGFQTENGMFPINNATYPPAPHNLQQDFSQIQDVATNAGQNMYSYGNQGELYQTKTN
ncbi:hypothetical protein SNEBB_011487 [Seison nebaliae]|nr:hypothetical protein SNEBB_011487 [Seison nebaliae]